MPYAKSEDRIARDAAYYQRNADAIKDRERLRYHALTQEQIEHRRAVQRKHHAKNAERERVRYAVLRKEIVAAYGGRCACCGEAEIQFLELDHAQNDGASHRKTLGRGARPIYRWLKARDFPKKGFQLLCANCNQGKNRNGGVCPHAKGQYSSQRR